MTSMSVLIIGSGGREHALAIGLSQSPSIGSIHTAPGNAGTAILGTNHEIDAMDIEGLVSLAQEISADLVVVGPEGPLVAGISDRLREIGIPTFGPGAKGAMLNQKDPHGFPRMRFWAKKWTSEFSFANPSTHSDHWGPVSAQCCPLSCLLLTFSSFMKLS